MRYRGSCHCGAVKFSFESEPITEGKRCNCSICIRKGAVMSATYVALEIEGMAALSVYLWNDRDCRHYFCATCGIFPFAEGVPGMYRVNLGCVEGVDPLALPVTIIDGRSL